MGILGLVWAALKFMAPIAGEAFLTPVATRAGTLFAEWLMPEAKAAGVHSDVIDRGTQLSLRPADQQVLQPVFVHALTSKPQLANRISAEIQANVPDVAESITRADHLFRTSPQLGNEFTAATTTFASFDELFTATMHFTDAQTRYWIEHVCPKGGEPALVVTYIDGLGRETAMSRGPDYLMDDNGATVPNVIQAMYVHPDIHGLSLTRDFTVGGPSVGRGRVPQDWIVRAVPRGYRTIPVGPVSGQTRFRRSDGMLSSRLPTRIGVALHRFAFPSGRRVEAWL